MKMIERVARAMASADGMHPDTVSNDEDQVPIWKAYASLSSSAIEAMMEPTEAMAEAFREYAQPIGYFEEGYQAMIRKALEE